MYRSNGWRLSKKCVIPVLLTAVLGFQTSCTGATQISNLERDNTTSKGEVVGEKISLTVEVASFQSQAIHDDFAGGVSSSYDLTLLRIVEPGARLGAQLKVIHPSGSAPDQMWTSVGRRCIVKIEPWILNDTEVLIPSKDIDMICQN